MRTAVKLTMDGLVRALRARAHRMADEIEAGYAEPMERAAPGRMIEAQRRAGAGVQGDDVSGD